MGEHTVDNKGRPYETAAKVRGNLKVFKEFDFNCKACLSCLLKVPFIIRYPAKIPAGRIVQKTWSSIDFGKFVSFQRMKAKNFNQKALTPLLSPRDPFIAPTILSLIGVNINEYDFHGQDMSSDIFNSQSDDEEDNTIFLEDTYQGRWAAVISNGYKFVLSKSGIPWVSLLR